ncbi:phage antirepressor N-terminal domain-containing protein [Zhihengliuella halotolerans]|uniref:phage antirepressor N-terminal domain-containing protein n=1 Tax=Zhihengliuella halotolerans TaxID=370736 RepID=UPI000C809E7A|nr:phage antirepressor N-terminal domain-containing protein [Zhihengliuella halotolerans]
MSRRLEHTDNATILFNGVAIPVVYDRGVPRIILRPVCRDLGIDWPSQLSSLKTREWADLKPLRAHTSSGQYREVTTVTPLTFLRWLNTLRRVPAGRAPIFQAYQDGIAEALATYAGASFPRARARGAA